jgi:hypothetical protein
MKVDRQLLAQMSSRQLERNGTTDTPDGLPRNNSMTGGYDTVRVTQSRFLFDYCHFIHFKFSFIVSQNCWDRHWILTLFFTKIQTPSLQFRMDSSRAQDGLDSAATVATAATATTTTTATATFSRPMTSPPPTLSISTGDGTLRSTRILLPSQRDLPTASRSGRVIPSVREGTPAIRKPVTSVRNSAVQKARDGESMGDLFFIPQFSIHFWLVALHDDAR